ncbi:unnamed protein product [Clavelina lepadiformis]|uniref:Uncharacterized protein n=1 Tax=Clavelina lepadiformis TaxID=159417 RepID=A0ABP0FLT5_CLALP
MRPVKVRKSAAISPAAAESARATRQALPFASRRFHVLFNSLFKVLFNFPSRYLFAIGLATVFSLRWSLPPALGCIPKQPDSEKTPSTHANRRHGPDTRYGTKPRSEGRGRSATRARRILYATIRSAPKATGFGDGLIPLHSPLLRESSRNVRDVTRAEDRRRSRSIAATWRNEDTSSRSIRRRPRSPIACRTLADFDGTAETQVLRPTPHSPGRQAHRDCFSDDPEAGVLRPSSTREPSDPPPRAIIVYRFSFYEAVATGLILSAERTISRPSLETARVLDARERLVPCRAPQRARLDLDKRESGRFPGDAAATRAGASVRFDNDPSAGSPTETLLRLLLPLNDQVRSSFRTPGPAVASRSGSNRRTSLNHSIGSSDGRCVQRAGT